MNWADTNYLRGIGSSFWLRNVCRNIVDTCLFPQGSFHAIWNFIQKHFAKIFNIIGSACWTSVTHLSNFTAQMTIEVSLDKEIDLKNTHKKKKKPIIYFLSIWTPTIEITTKLILLSIRIPGIQKPSQYVVIFMLWNMYRVSVFVCETC